MEDSNRETKKYTIRLIIAGGRDFDNFEMLKREVFEFLRYNKITSFDEVEIVSGCANGADKLGEDFAAAYGIPVALFPARWSYFGAQAGPIRNGHMAQYATHCICFWDGESKGTANMIKQAGEKKLVLRVVRYMPGLPHIKIPAIDNPIVKSKLDET